MTVCIVDTSILVELLDVPGKVSHRAQVLSDFEQRQKRNQQFLLPVAVLIETGNHIAQVSDGRVRRERAGRFVKFAGDALEGQSPFVATPFPANADVATWLADFPDYAMRGLGLADRSVVALWHEQRALNRDRRVYVWALDAHLSAYDTDGTPPSTPAPT